ncbi:hypothetical protein WJ590_003643 [Escherichia coli]|jgi:hypothetical protein|uniref:hypothetical protein n=1 Tax=Enterobacterales TaxID=91347 RepID=UPI00114F8992|nr:MULTISPECIES: hypothetical protein [Enterobacteriaceae]EBV3411908.1 hypothetical protein [Salmonella enterica subsp. enterica serovar Heidelberg]ECD7530883.1 hypothetical protein [Salmonella enterica subsp. enterica serovar Enteritidis]EGZ3553171.1 hypothetical protein [Salmonella enterica]QMF95549.1 hypothetical protein HVY71_26090 [Citrobacter freundii]HCR2156957.1 hypothetical protein [Enterobacter asburiae]HDR2785792.1 hypothetical protein [Enterobacter sichuanensis]
MKKRKGDVHYYLEKNDGIYHLVKRVKTFSKKLTPDGVKTTLLTVSDFFFNKDNFYNVDFSANGLREKDKAIIEMMIIEIENAENGTLQP